MLVEPLSYELEGPKRIGPATLQVAIDNILGYLLTPPSKHPRYGRPPMRSPGTALYQAGASWIDAPRPDGDLGPAREGRHRADAAGAGLRPNLLSWQGPTRGDGSEV
jgi:hypothetical protein